MRVGTRDTKGTMMAETADSIVVKRLVRNLRYKLTYIKVFESFLQPEPYPAVVRLLQTLVSAQQTAVVPLSGYLQGLGVVTQGLPLDQRLLDHASSRNDVKSRLQFVHYGLRRAVSWYKAQWMDRQMTADPEPRRLLLDLGENEAASLWRTEAIMVMLRIRQEGVPEDTSRPSLAEPDQGDVRRSRPMGTSRRPAWGGKQPTKWPRLSRASSEG
jgi:hypothetical protein